MISWDFFLKRRLKNNDGLRIWADNHGVKSYEDLLECLNLQDVIAPTREQVEFLFLPPEELPSKMGVATKRFTNSKSEDKQTTKSSSSSPRDYGVYKAADQKSSDKS